MSSQLAWVDFAEEDRQRMLDVVHLFREQGTVDELGVGRIRDALADHFFPGTSTIQTRARYMLFVPWIYQALEARKTGSAQIASRARSWEIALIDVLVASEDQGIIGSVAHKDLQRLPSSTYWNGLASWGIRLFPGSQDQYHRYLDTYYQLRDHRVQDDDREPVGGPVPFNWDPGLPEQPEDLWESCGMALTKEEAQYLHDKILLRHRHSLLAKLVDAPFLEEFIDFPWQHRELRSLPEGLQEDLRHARNFSEVMHGAALLYNLMLARERGEEEWITRYDESLAGWVQRIRQRHDELLRWYENLDEFWALTPIFQAKIPHLTIGFVNRWFELVFGSFAPEKIADDRDAHRLIHDREGQLKGPRARLENPSALKMWGGASGNAQLDFRWGSASNIIDDITTGLQEGA